MKKLIPLMLALFAFGEMQAQQNFEITWASDSTWGALCTAPQEIEFIAGGWAGPFDPFGTDSVYVSFNFGDGSETTVASYLYGDFAGANFFASAFHTYSSPGNYTVQYIAYGATNGASFADTVLVVDEIIISDTCGSVEGLVYVDDNNNCMHDPGEPVLPNVYVNAQQNGNWMDADYTDANGMYHFDLPIGQTFDVELYTNGFTNVCPSTLLSVSTIPSDDNDFGVYCDTVQFDLTGSLSGWAFRPGLIGYLHPHIWNNGCLPQDGQVKILLDPLTTFVSDWPQNSVTMSGDTLIVDFDPLSSYNWQNQYFSFGLMVDSTAILDSLVCFEMWVCPEDGDFDPTNNYIQECFTVVNSYDPNDKQVTPAGIGPMGAIGQNETMTYTVRFQNTGTAEAFNVHIMDTIDTDLDMSTFQVVSASHNMDVYFPNERIVKFNFPNINLPDSTTNEAESHGEVVYRISQKPNLTQGTVMENTAHIYFDINPAVVTNTTVNTIDLAVGITPIGGNLNTVNFYPNPATNSITINSTDTNSALSIFDMSGRAVHNQILQAGNTDINISQFENGTYIIRVDNGTKLSLNRLVKMN
ncbi:MAG: putative repeat protein (TIGR01451 family) [Bacteroidia bacterium]|jgi:uncharacterized repeat protein (TIGR01451 family)